jgi:hypothetical protein
LVDAFGEFGERQPAIALQLGKDFPVNVVHGEDSSMRSGITEKF